MTSTLGEVHDICFGVTDDTRPYPLHEDKRENSSQKQL